MRIQCPRCGERKKLPAVPVEQIFPYHCRCGQTFDGDGAKLFFTPPARLPYWKFGDWLAILFRKMGLKKWKGCKCSARQNALNLLGYRCWRFVTFFFGTRAT